MRIGLRILKPETVKCPAFASVTAWRVFSLDRYARGARMLPPAEHSRPFPPDIRNWELLLARIAGWQPSMQRPLRGNDVLWRACVHLQMMVRMSQPARARQP